MLERQQVIEWLESENKSTKILEDEESVWRVQAQYPTREQGFSLDVLKLRASDAVLVLAGITIAGEMEDLQRRASTKGYQSFLARLKLDLLRSPVQYRLNYSDEGRVLQLVELFYPLYAEEQTRARLMRAMADVHRAALSLMVHLELLRIEEDEPSSQN